MRIALCDDSRELRGMLTRYIENWSSKTGEPAEIAEYKSAEEFLFNWSPSAPCDILFLDIAMDGMSGMDLAKLIRRIDKDLPIVFVTGSREHVFSGYDVGALFYLLKPIAQKDCDKCLERVCSEMRRDAESVLVIAAEGKTRKVACKDITYVESFNHDVIVHTVSGDIRFRKKIGELEEELPHGQFIRTHRSYMVHLRCIRAVEHKKVVLDDGSELPISRERRQIVNQAFIRYHMA